MNRLKRGAFCSRTLPTPLISYPDQVLLLGDTLTPTVSSGTPPYSYSIVSGSLPAGAMFDPATGNISSTSVGNLAPVANTGSGLGYSGGIDRCSDGGFLICGVVYTADIAFGGITATESTGVGTGYVAKMSSTGTFEWVSETSGGDVTFKSLSGTPDGGAVVCGYIATANANFGAFTLTKNTGTNTAFVAKIGSTGTWEWVIGNGSAGTGTAIAYGVAAVGANSAIVTGMFRTADITFGGTTLTRVTSANDTSFVAKVTSGAWDWALTNTSATSNGTVGPLGIVAAPDGGCAITGYISGINGSTVTFGAAGTITRGDGIIATFVAKVTSAGAWDWVRATAPISGTYSAYSNSIDITADGDFVIGGWIRDGSAGATFSFGSTTITRDDAHQAFAAKVNSAGWVWATANTGATGATIATRGICATPDGGVIIGGSFVAGAYDFGSTNLSLTGTQPAFVAKLDSTGAWEWAIKNSAGNSVYFFGDGAQCIVSTEDNGAMYFAHVNATTTFGSASVTLAGTPTAFVARVNNLGEWGSGTEYADTPLTIRVTDFDLSTGDAEITLTRTIPPLTISYADQVISLGEASVPTTAGGKPPYSYSVLSGSVPTGVVFNPSTGALTASPVANMTPRGNTGTGQVYSHSMVRCSDGGFLVLGLITAGTVTFGSDSASHPGGTTSCVAKLSATGTWEWVLPTVAPSPFTGTANPFAIGATTDGGAVVLGYITTGTVEFGATSLTKNTGTNTVFVAKVSSTGAWEWATKNTAVGAGSAFPGGILGVGADSAVITGTYDSTNSIIFGGTTLATSGLGNTMFVAKVTGGTWDWAVRNTSTGNGGADGLKVIASPSGSGYSILTSISGGTDHTFGAAGTISGGIQRNPIVTINDSGVFESFFYPPDGCSVGNIAASPGGKYIIYGQVGGAYLTVYTFGSSTLTKDSAAATESQPYFARGNASAWDWAVDGRCSPGMFINHNGLIGTPDGGLIASGNFTGASPRTVTYGATSLTVTGVQCGWVAKVTPSGTWDWFVKNSGGSAVWHSSSRQSLVSADDNGALFLFHENATATFGSGSLTLAGATTTGVARIRSDGVWGTGSEFGSTGVTIRVSDVFSTVQDASLTLTSS